MRLAKGFEKHGYWWLQSKPEKKLPGVLKISESGDAELEVIGVFGDEFSDDVNIPRIVGVIEGGKLVTLEKCFYKKKSFAFGVFSKSIVCVNLVLVGVQFKEDESISFSSFIFSVEGLDDWLSITGISVNHDWKNKSASITFKRPEDITIDLPNSIKLSFTFGWTFPSGGITEAKITQKAYIKLEASSLISFHDFTNLIFKLNNFLCLAVDETVTINSATAFSYEVKEKVDEKREFEVPIDVFYSSLPYTDTPPKIQWHKMLFRYGIIAKNLRESLTLWLGNYDKLEPAFNLYFSSKSEARRFSDSRFLSLAQGLETFHRRSSTELVMPPEYFNSIVSNLLSKCPDEKKSWLKGILAHANEIPLRKRLKQMLEPFKPYFGSCNERESLINSIVDTRNYLTHYDPGLENTAATGFDLYKLCIKMECLFQLHFLQLLGFTEDQIKVIVNNNHKLKQNLNEI